MAEQVTLTIDGREITVPDDVTVLDAAKSANIQIPNLCHNDELKPYGSCRLCMVEATKGKRTRMVASCIYSVADGLEVKTNTDKVNNVRKLVVELLMARNPFHHTVKELAESLGIEKTNFKIKDQGCILCGSCVRVCREVVGVSAINFKGRGHERIVTTPFDEAPPDCIACGSCAYICPVDVIPLKEADGIRKIWNTEFLLRKCKECGRYVAPEKQIEYVCKTTNLPDEHFDTCLHCR